jgi:uncharacterized linocin/CFP29 family protein
MLLFTQEQELALNSAREQFNTTQVAMATNVGLVGNASPIPLDAWRRIDTRGAALQRDILVVFNTLASASTDPIGVGDIMSYYPQISDSGEVSVTMDGRHAGLNDQANVKYVGTPVPAVSAEARFGWRQMATIGKSGMGLDMATIANEQRKVAEKLEDMVINGNSTTVVGGNTIYGLRTFPQRNTDTHGLTLASATGAQWVTAVGKAMTALEGDNAFGPVTIFVNYGDLSYAKRTDYAAAYTQTIYERLLSMGVVLVGASKVPANELLAVNNLSSGLWGSILQAMPMATAPKARLNQTDDYVFQVMAMAAPQFRADYDGKSQIAHITAA